jgi:hypothetical protein
MMAGKYTPLEQYLRDLPENQREITLSFERVEQIINDKLPPSAYQYQAWWANEKNPHQPEKQAIMNAGWKVGTIKLPARWVRLLRNQK